MWNSDLVRTGNQQPTDDPPEEPRADPPEEKERDPNGPGPDVIADRGVDAATENCTGCAPPAPRGNLPNGVNASRRGPESASVDFAPDEGRPLISPPPESVELTVWSSEGRGEAREAAAAEASRGGRCCCCQCRCCRSGRVPALLSVLASLLCAAGIFYALYFCVPIKPPDCPDAASRVAFALCCCVVASVPVLLGRRPTPARSRSPITDRGSRRGFGSSGCLVSECSTVSCPL